MVILGRKKSLWDNAKKIGIGLWLITILFWVSYVIAIKFIYPEIWCGWLNNFSKSVCFVSKGLSIIPWQPSIATMEWEEFLHTSAQQEWVNLKSRIVFHQLNDSSIWLQIFNSDKSTHSLTGTRSKNSGLESLINVEDSRWNTMYDMLIGDIDIWSNAFVYLWFEVFKWLNKNNLIYSIGIATSMHWYDLLDEISYSLNLDFSSIWLSWENVYYRTIDTRWEAEFQSLKSDLIPERTKALELSIISLHSWVTVSRQTKSKNEIYIFHTKSVSWIEVLLYSILIYNWNQISTNHSSIQFIQLDHDCENGYEELKKMMIIDSFKDLNEQWLRKWNRSNNIGYYTNNPSYSKIFYADTIKEPSICNSKVIFWVLTD